MLAFIIRRLLQAIVVMLTVALIAFTLFRFVGDPVNMMVGIETTAEERAKLRQDLGLNDPVPIQFAHFVGNAARLNFGNSYQFKTPVIDLIADRFPATMELAFASALFSLLIGIPMGVYTALHRRSMALQYLPRGLAGRHFAADFPHRHPADLPVPGHARRAAVVRARRRGAARLLDNRAADRHPA